MIEIPEWPRSGGHSRPIAVIKSSPEDFRVFEIPLIEPEGSGTHLWLEVEKTGANTEWVARQLATLAGVKSRDIGYAGMKDRHAVTRQWFSIACQEAGDTDWQGWDIEGVHLRSGHWHSRKLQRGTLGGNHFEITLRSVEGDTDALEQALEVVAARGVPNYFGPQRFGHNGGNVRRAMQWFSGGGRLPRQKQSLYLSAARSFLFNQILAERVRHGNWDQLLDGDIANLDGRRSVFVCQLPDANLELRCASGEIHPAGCLYGKDGLDCERDALELQEKVVGQFPELCDGLQAQGLKRSWRSLRLKPNALTWQWQDDALVLAFDLPSGAFATVLLDALVSVHDASISKAR